MTLTGYAYNDYINDSAYCSNCKGLTLLNTLLLPNMKAEITCRHCNETAMCYVGFGKNGKPSLIPIKDLRSRQFCVDCCNEYFGMDDTICPRCNIKTEYINLDFSKEQAKVLIDGLTALESNLIKWDKSTIHSIRNRSLYRLMLDDDIRQTIRATCVELRMKIGTYLP